MPIWDGVLLFGLSMLVAVVMSILFPPPPPPGECPTCKRRMLEK